MDRSAPAGRDSRHLSPQEADLDRTESDDRERPREAERKRRLDADELAREIDRWIEEVRIEYTQSG